MEYKKLVDKLSEKSGIDRAIFNLEFEAKVAKNLGLIEVAKIEKKGYYFSEYYLLENIGERWKAVALFIPKEILIEFIEILNSIFEEEKEELIDIDKIPDNFQYFSDDKSFIVVYGKNLGEVYRIDFARKNEQ